MTDTQPPTKTRSQTIAEARAAAAIARRQTTGSTEVQSATGTAITRSSETAAAAVAAHAEAMAKARFFVAIQRPRNLDDVRDKLLTASADPVFAEDATYELKRWDARAQEERVISGFSARFAEAARTALGNIDVETMVVLDDDEKLIVQVVVTDLESNVTERVPVVVRKRIERRKLNKGQIPISSRVGADGQTVYLVAATDDEVQMRLNSAQSKATRNAVLRLLRADIRQECWDQVQAAQRMAAQQEGAASKVLEVFRGLGVSAEQLASFLGHPVADLQAQELAELRGIARAIRDGEATWAEVAESRGTQSAANPTTATPPATKAPTRDELVEQVQQRAATLELSWELLQRTCVRLSGGKAPDSAQQLTKLQAEKLLNWLNEEGAAEPNT